MEFLLYVLDDGVGVLKQMFLFKHAMNTWCEMLDLKLLNAAL